MSLNHILLGMLKAPTSGYDLRKKFGDGPIHFWSAELSQIYPALGRMTDVGWLRSESAPSEKGPPRVMYERTESGTEELKKWVSSGLRLHTERAEHIGQLIFMGVADDLEVTQAFLKQLLEYYEEKQTILEAACRTFEGIDPADPNELDVHRFHDLISVEVGAATFKARAQVYARVLELVEQRMKGARTHV